MSRLMPGLCATCSHARAVRTESSVYVLCELSKENPRFRKYPPLPVLLCEGHQPVPPKDSAI